MILESQSVLWGFHYNGNQRLEVYTKQPHAGPTVNRIWDWQLISSTLIKMGTKPHPPPPLEKLNALMHSGNSISISRIQLAAEFGKGLAYLERVDARPSAK